jgi:HK97 family phage prohead protease
MEKLDFGFEIKEADIKEDGTFEGYGSTFGGIPDAYGDVIAQGAFRASLQKGGRNGNGIALLWQHNPDQPIGIWRSITEDSKGLAVSGKLAREVRQAEEAYILLKMGALKGMSIGYDTVEYEFNKDTKIRTLKEVNLWEISLVTFPANVSATVTGVKALEEAKNIRDFERILREAGLSSRQAVYICSLCKSHFDNRSECDKLTVASAFQAALAEVMPN